MSTVTDLESYQQFALQQQAANNAWSAEQAQKQMDFQRDMSNTAHQREVADLQAAGLNPILSANSGASVPNGAQAEGDRSAAGNVGAILQQVLQAQSAREVAAMYNAATINAAQIAAGASMYGSDMQYKIKNDFPSGFEAMFAKVAQALFPDLFNTNSGKTTNSNPGPLGSPVGSSHPQKTPRNTPFSGGHTVTVHGKQYPDMETYMRQTLKIDPNKFGWAPGNPLWQSLNKAYLNMLSSGKNGLFTKFLSLFLNSGVRKQRSGKF